MNGSVDGVVKLPEADIEVWKAKHLVDREWEEDGEDGKGKQPAVEAESKHPRSRPTRSRSPDFAESSKGDSEIKPKDETRTLSRGQLTTKSAQRVSQLAIPQV